MESNSVCNHASDKKIRRPRSGSPICFSRVCLQTELDDTNVLLSINHIITISEKKKNSQVMTKGEICIKILTKEA